MAKFNFDDWVIGISTLAILFLGYSLGFFFFYKSRKMKATLLSILSLSMISVSFGWLAVVLDFFMVLITNTSGDLLIYIHLTWIQLPITVFLSQYIAAELLLPSRKMYVVYFLELFGILFLISLCGDPVNSVNPVGYPSENFYYKISLNFNSITGIIGMILIVFVILFSGIGYIYKSTISNTLIRNNFRFLGLGMIFISLFGLLDSVINGIFLVLVRVGAIIGLFLTYWGLKPRIQKKHDKYESNRIITAYFLHKPKFTNNSEEIEYYLKFIRRPIIILLSFHPIDLKLFKIREIAQKLKEFPEINNKIYLTNEIDDDIFEFAQNIIDKFDIMLLFCSKESYNSTELKNQWISAFKNDKPIIPVYIKSDYIPEILKQNEKLLYDLYDFNKNMLNLRHLILKSIFFKKSL